MANDGVRFVWQRFCVLIHNQMVDDGAGGHLVSGRTEHFVLWMAPANKACFETYNLLLATIVMNALPCNDPSLVRVLAQGKMHAFACALLAGLLYDS